MKNILNIITAIVAIVAFVSLMFISTTMLLDNNIAKKASIIDDRPIDIATDVNNIDKLKNSIDIIATLEELNNIKKSIINIREVVLNKRNLNKQDLNQAIIKAKIQLTDLDVLIDNVVNHLRELKIRNRVEADSFIKDITKDKIEVVK